MEKRTIIILIVLLLIVGCNQKNTAVIVTNDGKVTVNIDVVDEEDEMIEGLTKKDRLGENEGMLFVFKDEEIRRFYTKGMKFSIDIIFISSEGRVVDMIDNFEPCEEDPCLVYESGRIAKYALEVKAGFIGENGVLIGDKVKINI